MPLSFTNVVQNLSTFLLIEIKEEVEKELERRAKRHRKQYGGESCEAQ